MTKCVRHTEEFKRDAVFQVTDRSYSVKEVSVRLGISTKSLYDWIKQFKKPEGGSHLKTQHDKATSYGNRFHPAINVRTNLTSLNLLHS